MTAQLSTGVSVEDYFTLDDQSPTKVEWTDGEVREMVGASRNYNLIQMNLAYLLRDRLQLGRFEAYGGDMRVRIPGLAYYYPDLSVVRLPPEFEEGTRPDTLLNSGMIMEVLSPSTEAIDRGEKLDNYRRIPSLTDYLLVSQDQVRVDHYHRENTNWNLTIHTERETSVSLEAVGIELPMSELFARVFPNTETSPSS